VLTLYIPCIILIISYTDLRRLTTEIRSERCVVRRFRRCTNVIECACTNLDGTV
jgi:hypothetical protein